MKVLNIAFEGAELQDIQIGEKLWTVLSAPTLVVNGRLEYDIPKWFILDYASFPDFAYQLVSVRDEVYDLPALFHDYLTRNRKTLGLSFADCHSIFYAALLHCKCPEGLAKLMYSSVYAINWAVAGDGKGEMRFKIYTQEVEQWYQVRKAFETKNPVVDFNGEVVAV